MTKLKRNKNEEAGYTLPEVALVVGSVVWLAAVISIFCVVLHFVAKHW